ncbi:transposase (plasmid) [Streptomyces sp. NBC_00454]
MVDPADDTCRRQMHKQLTVQESRHKLGRYSFSASVPRKGLRPLRDPDAVELDDDDDGGGE